MITCPIAHPARVAAIALESSLVSDVALPPPPSNTNLPYPSVASVPPFRRRDGPTYFSRGGSDTDSGPPSPLLAAPRLQLAISTYKIKTSQADPPEFHYKQIVVTFDSDARALKRVMHVGFADNPKDLGRKLIERYTITKPMGQS